MALPVKSSGSLSLPRRDSSRRESVSPFAGRRESINPFSSRRESISPLATRRESVAPFQGLNRRESTVGLPRRESSSPFPSLRRASTIGHVPTGAYSNIPSGRKFSVSASSIYSGGDISPIEPSGNNDDLEVLFHHPTRIVSFTISEEKLKGKDVASYVQPAERTLSSGPMKIYRVKFSTTFLQGGQLLQPLLPRSACWCMDERRGIFVLRIRKDNYYRLELQEIEDDLSKVHSLKSVLDNIIVFEKTNCPFRSEKQDVEEPAPLPVFRRSSSVASRPSRPSSAQSDYGVPENDSASVSSEIVFQNPGFAAPPRVETTTSMPVMFRKNIFEDKPMLRVPRLQVPQQHNLSANPRALSPLSRNSLSRTYEASRSRSVSPLARESPHDMFMIPENGPPLPYIDDEADSTRSVGSGPPSPRYIPRSVPSDYGTSAAPSDYAASAASASATSSPIDPLCLTFSVPESRGRSPERKPMLPSPPPTATSPPATAPMHFLRPPSVVVQNADAPDFEIDFLDLDIRHSPRVHEETEEKPKSGSKPQPLEEVHEEPRHEPMNIAPLYNEVHENANDVPSIFEPLQTIQETSFPQVRPQTPLPSPPATPPLSHSASDSESEEIIEAVTPESRFHRKPSGDISNVSLRRASEPAADTSSVAIQNNDPDAMTMDEPKSIDPLEGSDMSLIARANVMPVTKTPGTDDYEPISRTGRRFIRSMDHEAARGIFGKTINLKIHKPSSFLLKFMLRVADKLMKGAKIYVYYWGDWKNGKVKGKGGKVKDTGSVDLTDSSPISPQEHEKMGLLSDEDDYGAKISNEATTAGRKRKPFSFARRDSA